MIHCYTHPIPPFPTFSTSDGVGDGDGDGETNVFLLKYGSKFMSIIMHAKVKY